MGQCLGVTEGKFEVNFLNNTEELVIDEHAGGRSDDELVHATTTMYLIMVDMPMIDPMMSWCTRQRRCT